MDYSSLINDLQSQIQSAYQGAYDNLQNAVSSYQNSLTGYQEQLGNYVQSYQDSLGQMLTAPDPFDQSVAYMDILRQQADMNNTWSAEQAQKQMDFQERMSNTAIQRQVADLKAAGINPVLSARLGGASTPNGSSATADTSIVSSMVQLFDKMLEVQGTSALAAYAAYNGASGSGSGTYGYDTGSSGKGTFKSLVEDLQNVAEESQKTTTQPQDVSIIGTTNAWSRMVASFYNGLKGVSDYKNGNKTAYGVGNAIGANVSRPAIARTEKEYSTYNDKALAISDKIANAVGSAVSAVKGLLKK